MARDNFIGWSLNDKMALLRGVQESRLTGQIVRLQTAHGVFTEFDPTKVNNTQVLEELESSILNDPGADLNDPIVKAIAANRRPGTTRGVFCR